MGDRLTDPSDLLGSRMKDEREGEALQRRVADYGLVLDQYRLELKNRHVGPDSRMSFFRIVKGTERLVSATFVAERPSGRVQLTEMVGTRANSIGFGELVSGLRKADEEGIEQPKRAKGKRSRMGR